jgi:hypothetical protein
MWGLAVSNRAGWLIASRRRSCRRCHKREMHHLANGISLGRSQRIWSNANLSRTKCSVLFFSSAARYAKHANVGSKIRATNLEDKGD